MSVLDGFFSTWSNAKATFGEGTPQTGEQYDGSAKLGQARSTLDSAAPGSRWTGGASTAYGAANTEHQRVIGELGGLDKRLAAHVNQSAEVVANGRTQLDAVRKWVTDAAASVPPGKDQDRMLMPIVNKGIGQVIDIVQKTNGELGTIGGKIQGLDGKYQELGNQKFAPKDGPQFGIGDEKMGPPDPEEQAEKDVKDALDGKGDAAKRVDDALKSIKPGQPLTPAQDAYLTQMQAQQKGMSIYDLSEAEKNLGDHQNIIADSWQLMSNDDVYYKGAGADSHGTAAQLPDSVQDALNNAGEMENLDGAHLFTHHDDLRTISEIVQHGNSEFQTGTELDRGLMRAADTVMDSDSIEPYQANLVQDIFDAAGRDHQIVRDQMLGIKGDDGDDFLRDINTMHWTDDGKSAAALFSWTNEASTGPEAYIAGETAEKYSSFLGIHKDELMDMNGQTLGEINPELVRGYSTGLTPYISDIAGLSTDNPNNNFDPIDTESPSERPVAKGIFSVLSTDAEAYQTFHSAADAQIIAASHAWSEDVKNGVHVPANDARLLDAQTLKALETVGTTEAAQSLNLNASQVYEQQKSAYDAGLKIVTTGSGFIPGYGQFLAPGIDQFGTNMQSSIIGTPPDTEHYTIAPLDNGESARFALNALLANDVPLVDNTQGGFNHSYFEPIDPDHPELGTRPYILDSSGLASNGIPETRAEQVLTQLLDDTVPDGSDPTTAMKNQYDDIIANPNPNPADKPGK
jgi:hypothetical protein